MGHLWGNPSVYLQAYNLKCITPTVYRTLFICFWCLQRSTTLKS
uniref:Uncharacterized protein n=1 Tax=Anguilla anguilla TaxID=7936 RepID=A0A0E9PN81_ANGAN